MTDFQIGDVVRHTVRHQDHAHRYFNGSDRLVIRDIGHEDGPNTVYYFVGWPGDGHRACRRRLELVERGSGPW